jgi:hypothetical protein
VDGRRVVSRDETRSEVEAMVADLRGQLDAVERVAKAAKPGPWHVEDGSVIATHPTDQVVDWVYGDSAEHIALNDPDRVLALVAAHRAILEEYEAAVEEVGVAARMPDGTALLIDATAQAYVLEQVVRHLAAGYADRDDGANPDSDPNIRALP